ncbi:MAG: hypothetical protein NDF54_09990 [archaeon GB-1867-035]|nr:hypothetical protein [Candidatus Culexmicrobium profundum]
MSMELDRKTKWALSIKDKGVLEILDYGKIKVNTLSESIFDVFSIIYKRYGHNLLEHVKVILLSIPDVASLFQPLKQSVQELYSSIKEEITFFNKEQIDLLFIHRDGNFYTYEEIISKIDSSEDIEIVDTYWVAPSIVASKYANSTDYIYLDMGSSTTSIIPVKDKRPLVDADENRLFSYKLICFGTEDTPLISVVNRIRRDKYKEFIPYIYSPVYMNDLFNIDHLIDKLRKKEMTLDELSKEQFLSLFKLSIFIGQFPFNVNLNLLSNFIKEVKKEIDKMITKYLSKIIKTYAFKDPIFVIGGDGKNLIFKLLIQHFSKNKIKKIPYGSEFSAIALAIHYNSLNIK